LIGVDVGTGSARAGVFDASGRMLASAKRQISLHRGRAAWSSSRASEIWRPSATASSEPVRGGFRPSDVAGIGFDATCSLVVLGEEDGTPHPVGPSGDPERDIIVWMDHRAAGRSWSEINAWGTTPCCVMSAAVSRPRWRRPSFCGSRKTCRNPSQRRSFLRSRRFPHLACDGDLARSTCTVTCKWTYLAHEKRWDPRNISERSAWHELADEGFRRIGTACRARVRRSVSGLTKPPPLRARPCRRHAGRSRR
jgi:D-ribulokinase